jgi:hypothetical protein
MRFLSELADSYNTAAQACEATATRIARATQCRSEEIRHRQITRMDLLLAEASALRAYASGLQRSFMRPVAADDSSVFESTHQGPHFNIDDLVYALGADGKEKLGAVVNRYEFGGTWRYVVECDDASEAVFFEQELMRSVYSQ